MSNRKGQRYGATPEELRANKAADAYNAGYRSVGRGDTGDEPRYLRYRIGSPESFAAGRKAAQS